MKSSAVNARTLLVAVLIFVSFACAGAPKDSQPRVSQDEFTGDQRVTADAGETHNLRVTYELLTTQTPTSKIKVAKLPFFKVSYRGTDWLFIRDRESLEFLADGARVAFDVFGDVNRQTGLDGNVRESAGYLVTPDELNKIVSAKQVKLRVTGDRGSRTMELTHQGISNGKRFYATYVQPDPIPAAAIQQLRGR